MEMRNVVAMALLALFFLSFKHEKVLAEGLTSVWLDDIVGSLDMGIESSEAHQICDESLGECEGNLGEFMMDSDVHGRLLRRVRYYISYGALRANRVPCPPRSGRSYYTRNCYAARGPVHPYRRSCTAITRCRRNTG